MAHIYSFDRTEHIEGEVLRPDRYRQLFSLLTKPDVISRGAGLSYCIASASAAGSAVLATEFNRFLAFDPERSVVRVEPGVTLGELFEFASTHNLVPPVLAGHPRITVGGAIAMNIHGKNQFRLGNFGNHVHRLTLYHPAHGELECSPNDNAELFRLTIGGFGLTGHVISADIALTPLAGTAMAIERHRTGNLIDAAQQLQDLSRRADYLYSWHDLNRSDDRFGCGTIYLERHTENASSQPHWPIRSVGIAAKPLSWPLFNRSSIPPLCRIYNLKENLAPRSETADLYRALFPIVGKEMYFRLFGPSGLREYQALFPLERWNQAAEQIKLAIHRSATPISLASLKLFSGERKFLNFSGKGICLALDTPNTKHSAKLFSRLDDIVIGNGGIAYIAKDSRLSASATRSMYEDNYAQFRSALRAYDPGLHFQSALRRRLDV
ncbi:MAG: FAD-binding oxidoreductase [Betaproteobacteria bacterium]|nr:FAD-binding oxidoreductase [Betaproteobacteria bacterium]